MRSYNAARALFSILAFFAWCVIALGILIAAIGVIIGRQLVSFEDMLFGLEALIMALPGLLVIFVGYLALAMAQMGRAQVDTAELTQQMLKVARDQLEVSQQGLRQGQNQQAGFATLNSANDTSAERSGLFRPATNGTERSSWVASEAAVDSPSLTAGIQPYVTASAEVRRLNADGSLLEYRGRRISVEDGKLSMNGIDFPDIERVQKYIDRLMVPPR